MTDTKVPFAVTAADVLDGLYDLAQERPGVYERHDGYPNGCVNIELVDGVRKPSCIVGSYYSKRVGVDNVEMTGNAQSTTEELLREGLITITPEARFMLTVAQALQDTRKVSWETIADQASGLKWAALSMHERLSEPGVTTEI